MALTYAEEQRLIDMVNRLSDSERESVTRSENSLKNWLRRAARWLWEKFTNTIIGGVISWLFGWI